MHPRIVMFFLQNYPQAASESDERVGWPPLAFYLLHSSVHKVVVEALVQAAPATIEFYYDFDREVNENDEREAEMPAPLFLAYAKNCKHNIIDALIPSNPMSPCLKVELPYGNIRGLITPRRAKLLAKRVSVWIAQLQFDASWFSQEGLATFLFQLAKGKPLNLTRVDMYIASDHFESLNVRRALSKLLRRSPNLASIRVRKPVDEGGPENDDALLLAIADGLEHSSTIKELCLAMVQGQSFTGLERILSQMASI